MRGGGVWYLRVVFRWYFLSAASGKTRKRTEKPKGGATVAAQLACKPSKPVLMRRGAAQGRMNTGPEVNYTPPKTELCNNSQGRTNKGRKGGIVVFSGISLRRYV